MGIQTETRRIDALNKSLQKMKKTTSTACLRCDQLTKRSRQLDSLTSPASDASSMLPDCCDVEDADGVASRTCEELCCTA